MMLLTEEVFDPKCDCTKVLLWQYNNAPRITRLVTDFNDWMQINFVQFWKDYQSTIFNLRNANTTGRVIWATILNFPIGLFRPGPQKGLPTWGFGEYNKNFENGNFYNGQTTKYALTPIEQRIVLRIYYYRYISNGTITFLNNMLADIWGPGSAYVEDLGDMKMKYVFNVKLSFSLMGVLTDYEILPKPAGVESTLQFN